MVTFTVSPLSRFTAHLLQIYTNLTQMSEALCGSWVLRIGPQHPLAVVEVRLNEVTRLPCVAIRNGGGRDPGG